MRERGGMIFIYLFVRNYFRHTSNHSFMRDLLKGAFARKHYKRNGKNKIAQEVLDTDEDRVINQYNVYRDYMLRLRKGLGYRRRMAV